MRLDGIHHITCITGDAPRNVEFYVGIMGLRMVKKTVNQDDPTIYHLFYADDEGSAGADLTFFEYPGAERGHAGAGMVHRIVWRVGSTDAVAFWEDRLRTAGVDTARDGDVLRFTDPEGLGFEIRVSGVPDKPLTATHADVPAEFAIQGFHGVHAYAADPERSRALLEQTLEFGSAPADGPYERWESRGPDRGSFYELETNRTRGVQAAGTVHHVAWASTMDDHETWRQRVVEAGMNPTPVIDRFWFRSIYFREPSGVLFEIATLGPGFTADEPLESLGEKLTLPPDYEHLRHDLNDRLTPLPDVAALRRSTPSRVS